MSAEPLRRLHLRGNGAEPYSIGLYDEDGRLVRGVTALRLDPITAGNVAAGTVRLSIEVELLALVLDLQAALRERRIVWRERPCLGLKQVVEFVQLVHGIADKCSTGLAEAVKRLPEGAPEESVVPCGEVLDQFCSDMHEALERVRLFGYAPQPEPPAAEPEPDSDDD